jgi:hypothetical protein
LADLLQACPPEEQRTAFFRGAFLMRLPSKIQVHLAQVETTDLKELAQKADQLWLTHRRPGLVAAMTAVSSLKGMSLAAEDGLVAAVAGKGGAKQPKKRNKKLVTFCRVHHKYGKDAQPPWPLRCTVVQHLKAIVSSGHWCRLFNASLLFNTAS